MPPRAGTKKAAPKRPARKAAVKTDEQLPDLESFLIELYNWPDVTDILMSGAFMEAVDEFTNVAEFRRQIKENLSTCYGRKRVSHSSSNKNNSKIFKRCQKHQRS